MHVYIDTNNTSKGGPLSYTPPGSLADRGPGLLLALCPPGRFVQCGRRTIPYRHVQLFPCGCQKHLSWRMQFIYSL